MPIDGSQLVVEPTYPGAAVLNKKPDSQDEPGIIVRNTWWSARLRAEVYVYEENGRIGFVVSRKAPHNFTMDISTFGLMDAWGLEQEGAAMKLLGSLVRHRQLKQYILTGGFLETSQRSGVTYFFRRLRPTVAIDARKQDGDESARILCTLCMHPIAYYDRTWAGAMCPTDDVVAHLMLMRGDEHMFWRRANQHAPDRPEAGL